MSDKKEPSAFETNLVLASRPDTAVFFNASGGVTIRQRCWPDEDVMVTFDVADVSRIIKALRQAVLEAKAYAVSRSGEDDA